MPRARSERAPISSCSNPSNLIVQNSKASVQIHRFSEPLRQLYAVPAKKLLRRGYTHPQTTAAAVCQRSRCGHKKAPDDAGAFELLKFSRDQYFATTGPAQLKR